MNRTTTGRAMMAAKKRGMDMSKVRPHTLILAAKLDPSESS